MFSSCLSVYHPFIYEFQMDIFAQCILVAAVALKFSNEKYKGCFWGAKFRHYIKVLICKVVSIDVSKDRKDYCILTSLITYLRSHKHKFTPHFDDISGLLKEMKMKVLG
jgi:hypothetical protein